MFQTLLFLFSRYDNCHGTDGTDGTDGTIGQTCYCYLFLCARAGEAKRLDGLPGRVDVQLRPESHPGQAAAGQGEQGGQEEAGRA